MTNPPIMDEAIRLRVYGLFTEAKECVARGNLDRAAHLCEEAWKLIPDPKYGWDSSYMCVLGMAQFLRGAQRYDRAIEIVQGYLDSEYHEEYQHGPHFWLGTLHFEKGELGVAYSCFDRANKISRGRCFRDEDPRYKAFFNAFKTKGRAS